MLKLITATETPESTCCECGHKVNMASGEGTPSPGDFSLCIECASLNVFSDGITFRQPTLDEYLIAAADSELQALRRIILKVQAKRKAE